MAIRPLQGAPGGATLTDMPTPFTHLEIAQRLLDDPAVPASVRAELAAERPAFLLGNIAADARVGSGARREHTHFYAYGHPIKRAPWRVMTADYPRLMRPHDAAHRVFVAGYVAHLSVDEYWTRNLAAPHFGLREWAEMGERFYMLHILLIHMDERDYDRLAAWQPAALRRARPSRWLSFVSDADLRRWRDLIADQLAPAGASQTLEIFGGRINRSPAELRTLADDRAQVQARLYDHVSRQIVDEIETAMYTYCREQMLIYWRESA